MTKLKSKSLLLNSVCTSARVCARVCECVCVYMYVCLYACVCVCVFPYLCLYVCVGPKYFNDAHHLMILALRIPFLNYGNELRYITYEILAIILTKCLSAPSSDFNSNWNILLLENYHRIVYNCYNL